MTGGARTPLTDRLERWLRDAGIEFRLFEHEPVRTSEEAARVRGTPSSRGEEHSFRSAFQPMCGILSELEPLAEKRKTWPGTRSRPRKWPSSSLSERRSCMPRQMPRKGRPERAASQTASAREGWPLQARVRLAMAAPKAPTPGRMTRSAAWMPAGELVITAWSKDKPRKNEIMGVKHRKFPIYGVQFHPESIGTEDGKRMLQNFLRIAHASN